MELDGSIPLPAVQKLEAALSARDLVAIRLTGVVEDENAAAAAAESLRERLQKRSRQAAVKLETSPASMLSGNSLARAFLAEMDAVKPETSEGPEYRRWLLARQYGLEEIAGRAAEAL